MLVAVDYANSRCKVVKVFTVKDKVWASIEIFVSSPDQFKSIFTRSMGALENGVSNFVEKLRDM